MDRLDELLRLVGPLLRQVDEVLTVAGAPPDHPVWTELRRVRLLPWDAVQAVAALRAAELTDVAAELRAEARSYADLAEAMPAPGGWTGDAADAYDDARRRVAAQLSGGVDGLDERLAATAGLADWMTRTRDRLAATLATVGTSAEALSLSFSADVRPPAAGDVRAAAEVATRVLGAVADGYETGLEALRRSTDLALPHGSR
jgi:uncharacterized protein YukE